MTHTHQDPMSLHDSNWPLCLDGVVHCPFWSGSGLQGNNVIALDKNEGSTFTPLLKDNQSQGAAREGLAMLGMIRTWYKCSWQDDMEGSDIQLPCTRLMYRLQNTWLIPEGALVELKAKDTCREAGGAPESLFGAISQARGEAVG